MFFPRYISIGTTQKTQGNDQQYRLRWFSASFTIIEHGIRQEEIQALVVAWGKNVLHSQ